MVEAGHCDIERTPGGWEHFTKQDAEGYVIADQPGGDILCEVVVYAGETRYDHGARVTAVIGKP